MIKSKIWLSLAKMSGSEQEFIQEAFNSNWVVPLGPNVDGFEKDLVEFIGNSKKVVALSAGTAAIHLGLIQMGVVPGDEVICQSFTFAATANPIKYLGANPVFVDSEDNSWNISPKLLKRAILERIRVTGKKPKAVIPVHLYGMPFNVAEVMAVTNKYEIPVLEDAAEALGSQFGGQYCGTFGEFACLSFNGNKIITTSGGGALVCPTETEAVQTKFLATQARDKAPHYQHSQIGYNYRLSNICAGIGRGQMTVLNDYIETRRAINMKYRELLNNVPGISFQTEPSSNYKSNYWLTCILIDEQVAGFSNEQLRLKMEQENIETRPLWKPMHLQPVFADCPAYLDPKYGELGLSGYLFEKGLCLPSHPGLTYDDIQRVVNVIKSMLK